MNIREAFLNSVDCEGPESLLDFVEKHNSKNESFDLTEVLQALSKKQHDKLWDGVKRLCSDAILKAAANQDGEDDENDDKDEINENMASMLSCLHGVTVVALCAINLNKPYIPSSLLETAIILHGIMMNIPDETQKAQNGIAQLCETWFINDFDGKEELITNTLPFLVIRTLAKGTLGDVKRIWSLRQSLMLMDLEDDSAEALKQLLQQCLIHPIFLRSEEGRRFLSFLFGMSLEFSKELHKTIKNQIPNCAIGTLSYYGEVYFRAWRVASGPYLQFLENDCFQDLMYAAIHAQRSGVQSMSSRLRKVLSYVHQQKKQQGVDEMLVRLYQPILWRSFKVANAMVRANASALLIDAFPLQSPEASNQEADELLQKQFDILQDLFEDPSPIVRATGVHGVCRISGVFWELIPVHTIKALLVTLTTEVAFDASSSTVRVAVFQGLKFLLENHLSHPLLKTLLGNLRDLIHDVSEKVRSAFLDLLLLVKGIKAIKFWMIVPLDHLLACLEVETSPSVLRKLVKLLMNSFHPLNKEADVQITRCAALWEANPLAARKFYQYAHLYAAVPSTGKFILLLCRCLVHWAKNVAPDTSFESFLTDETATSTIMDSSENKENETIDDLGSGDAVLTLPDIDTICGLLETIAISWSGIKDQLDKKTNETIKSKLVQYFKKVLPKLLTATENTRARAAIIVISAYLPAECLPTFSKKCLTALTTLHDGANAQDYGPMLDCLCSWGQAGKILDLVDSCLHNTFCIKGQAKGGKSARLTPLIDIDFIFWILNQPPCREAVMMHQEKLECIVSSLKEVTVLVESLSLSATNKRPSNQVDQELYPKALRLFCHLQVHLNDKSSKASEEMTDLLLWAANILLPRLDIYQSASNSTENGKRAIDDMSDTNCTKEILEVILSCSNELLKLGIADEQFCRQVAAFCKSLTQIGQVALQFLPHLSQLMYQVSQRMLYCNIEENENPTDIKAGFAQCMLADILRSISSNSDASNITQILMNIKYPLAEVLKTFECRKQSQFITEKSQMMASTMAACLAELLNKNLDFNEAPSISDLPQLSAFVLGILIKSKILFRSFVDELEQCVSSGAVQDRELILSSQYLFAAIVTANPNMGASLKSCGLKIYECLNMQQVNENDSYAEKNMEEVKALSKKTLEQIGVVV